jgi:hypothetical protein
MKMTPEVRAALAKAQKQVAKVTTYHPNLTAAILAVEDAVQAAGLKLEPEDTGGIYCGETGRTTWRIVDTPRVVLFAWYKMPSGNYEQTSYIS